MEGIIARCPDCNHKINMHVNSTGRYQDFTCNVKNCQCSKTRWYLYLMVTEGKITPLYPTKSLNPTTTRKALLFKEHPFHYIRNVYKGSI